MTRITLLTDFGTADGYVAAMKGVLAALAPAALVVDASHEVPRGDCFAAALALDRYWKLYPPGTVHCVVVDPGVGTDRKAVAVDADSRFLVAPDNGVVSLVISAAERWRAVELIPGDLPGPGASTTFHGRDLFAPAAARLARGCALDAFGPALEDVVLVALPEPVRREGGITGRVIAVDRFGNLVTNVPGDWLESEHVVRVGGREIGLRRSYGFARSGALLGVINSDGRLEVAERDGSAADTLGVGVGAPVQVVWIQGR